MSINNNEIIHTYVVLAYKESPYLEECIESVLNQDYKSKVLIGTSTDNEYIRKMADKYNLEVVVNPIKGGGNAVDFDFVAIRSYTTNPYLKYKVKKLPACEEISGLNQIRLEINCFVEQFIKSIKY